MTKKKKYHCLNKETYLASFIILTDMLNSHPSGGKEALSVPPTLTPPLKKRIKINDQNRHKTAAPAPFSPKHCPETDSPRDCTQRDGDPFTRFRENGDTPANGRAGPGGLARE